MEFYAPRRAGALICQNFAATSIEIFPNWCNCRRENLVKCCISRRGFLSHTHQAIKKDIKSRPSHQPEPHTGHRNRYAVHLHLITRLSTYNKFDRQATQKTRCKSRKNVKQLEKSSRSILYTIEGNPKKMKAYTNDYPKKKKSQHLAHVCAYDRYCYLMRWWWWCYLSVN